MKYVRVIPRDLFNEADLLKCLGRFEIMVLDNQIPGYKFETALIDPDRGFIIEQDPDDGSLYCVNYRVALNNRDVWLFRPLNSRQSYPLYAIYEGVEYEVLNEKGEFIAEFPKAPAAESR